MPRDEHGEYNENAGSPAPLEKGDEHPESGKEIKYHPCNAVLKFTMERYGETRYCTGMSVKNFRKRDDTPDPSYEHDQFCKHHQSRKDLQQANREHMKMGAFAKSYEHTFQYLDPHKQIVTIDLFESLLKESTFDFDSEYIVEEIDPISDGGDKIRVQCPIPSKRTSRAQAIWYAALDFVKMQNINEEQFRIAAKENLAVGEKEFEKETESGQVMTIVDEHHLNLPLSRIQKDYERHMKFGGVSTEPGEETDVSIDDRTWVLEVDEPKPEPEAAIDPSPIQKMDLEDNE